jgi:hypothetical protein
MNGNNSITVFLYVWWELQTTCVKTRSDWITCT